MFGNRKAATLEAYATQLERENRDLVADKKRLRHENVALREQDAVRQKEAENAYSVIAEDGEVLAKNVPIWSARLIAKPYHWKTKGRRAYVVGPDVDRDPWLDRPAAVREQMGR